MNCLWFAIQDLIGSPINLPHASIQCDDESLIIHLVIVTLNQLGGHGIQTSYWDHREVCTNRKSLCNCDRETNSRKCAWTNTDCNGIQVGKPCADLF